MYSRYLATGAAIVLMAASSCTSPGETGAIQSQAREIVSADTMAAGKKINLSKCAGCHNLYLPSAYASKEWPAIVKGMQEKAKLTNEEVIILTRYLQSGVK